MTEIIELNKGEVPFNNYNIYPNLGIQCSKIATLSPDWHYIIDSHFGIRISRDGVDYLIPFRKQNRYENESKFMLSINDFISSINYEVSGIVDKYIISNNTDLGSGNIIRIYKYKN